MTNGNGKGNRGRVIAKRLLLLRDFFFRRASKGRGASWSDICDFLATEELEFDRKTFYRDQEDLKNLFGLGFSYDKSDHEWRLATPIYKERELQTTINCIKSATFLSREEATAIAQKLEILSCLDKVKPLGREFRPDRMEKTFNHVKDNIKILLEAIKTDHQISFQYIVYPDFDTLMQCTSAEVDEYGRPLFFDEAGAPLHEYRESAPWNPIYVYQHNDGYYLNMSICSEKGEDKVKKSFNIAEMEHITILPEKRGLIEHEQILWGVMPAPKRTVITISTLNENLDIVKLFFEDADIILHEDRFTAKISVENVIDLIPCMLLCEYGMKIIEPAEACKRLERVGFMLISSYDKRKPAF